MFRKILAILILFSAPGNSNPILGGRNVGQISLVGNKVEVTGQDKFPFMAILTVIKKENVNGVTEETQIDCGAVIISTDAVLTAGHCLSYSGRKPIIFVQAGFVERRFEYLSTPWSWAEDFIVNEGYVEKQNVAKDLYVTYLSDIAIVWLEKPFVFGTNIQKANLAQFDGSLDGIHGMILGWGIDDSGRPSDMLKVAHTQVISNEECQKFCKNNLITPDMFCLLSNTRRSVSCAGDSGGPFVSGGIVYGISSFGFRTKTRIGERRKCDPTRPEIITHLGMYKEWIEEKLEERKVLNQAKATQLQPSCSNKFYHSRNVPTK